MEKRETTSVYEDGGRKFEINAYDPMNGNYILMQVMNYALPFNTESLGIDIPKTPISKEAFLTLQSDILSTVYEIYESGNKSPVLRPNGTWGISDVTMALTVKLLIASLGFNLKSFFDEFPLEGGLDSLFPSSLANTKI